jgi:hypothetical protein
MNVLNTGSWSYKRDIRQIVIILEYILIQIGTAIVAFRGNITQGFALSIRTGSHKIFGKSDFDAKCTFVSLLQLLLQSFFCD